MTSGEHNPQDDECVIPDAFLNDTEAGRVIRDGINREEDALAAGAAAKALEALKKLRGDK
jgi:hypothetical protein